MHLIYLQTSRIAYFFYSFAFALVELNKITTQIYNHGLCEGLAKLESGYQTGNVHILLHKVFVQNALDPSLV